MTDDLTAAVARLHADTAACPCFQLCQRCTDITAVLAALEAAQADARRYRWLRDEAPQKWAPWADERDVWLDEEYAA